MTNETRIVLEEIKENMDKAWEEHSEEVGTYDMWDRGIYYGINECKHLIDKYIIEHEARGEAE